MLRILPLASTFHAPDQVQATVARLTAGLRTQGIVHAVVETREEAPNALLIVTGGTEHLALWALKGRPRPVLLLAHPEQNSLPAAMEILAHLRQNGREGRILLLREDGSGAEPLRRWSQLLAVRERLAATRLGRIGQPSDWLVGSTPSPALVQEVWGPEVVDVPLEELRDALHSAHPGDVEAARRDFQAGARAVQEPSPLDLALAARVAVGLRRVVRDHRLGACTVRCFDLVTELGTTGCLALSSLLDEGVVAGCEGDLPSTLTMLWLQALSGEPSFMANPQDLDPEANTLWLAHCTVARSLLSGYALRSHFESGRGVGIEGDLPAGATTLARIGGADLRQAFLSDGEVLASGRSERRCRTQVQVFLHERLAPLLERPLGNHHVLARGHWARTLRDYHDLFIREA